MFTFFVLFLLYLIHFGIVNKARLVMKRASIGGMVKGSGQLFLCVCVCMCVCVWGGGGEGSGRVCTLDPGKMMFMNWVCISV